MQIFREKIFKRKFVKPKLKTCEFRKFSTRLSLRTLSTIFKELFPTRTSQVIKNVKTFEVEW